MKGTVLQSFTTKNRISWSAVFPLHTWVAAVALPPYHLVIISHVKEQTSEVLVQHHLVKLYNQVKEEVWC